MSSYYEFKGFWESLFVFNPFIAGENPRVANINVAEKPGHVFFKFISFFLVASDSDVPQRNYENETDIEDKNIKANAQYGVHELTLP
jgi:hypothetical protein